ncbi:HupE/UreJ family protein [Methylophilus sp. 14]|uniref:HupE/UreJ family protein n=1 Tax=Methylophilus sp. 14 TaxID=2781019 RepID=UPI00188E86B6|nr:HupE/UreJ family protein [Methylophilus sp. 14]MBF4987226.1 HupE/UreJ family protein [Methylophilus sp. 14]
MKKSIFLGVTVSLMSGMAWAHPGHGLSHGFAAGLLHPLTGWDHLLVMLSLGVWAARRPQGQGWQLPVLFVVGMAAAALTAMTWLSVSLAELLVAASVLVMGGLLLAEVAVSRSVQFAGVAVIAAAHGYLHGVELGGHWTALAGMMVATALLHGVGWLLGRQTQPWAKSASKLLGGLMLVFGACLFWA